MPTLNAPLRALVFGAALGAAALLGGSAPAAAHCQVPCGIYGDHARVDALLEDATTVDKAMAQIRELAGKADAQSLNQATRWVLTKEEHAQRLQDTIAAYFLAQRVKPADPKDGKATRVGFKTTDDGRKVRVAKRSGEVIDG